MTLVSTKWRLGNNAEVDILDMFSSELILPVIRLWSDPLDINITGELTKSKKITKMEMGAIAL